MIGAPGHPDLRTERLVLREWRDEDLEPFAALNADSEVMRFMPKLLSRDECATRIQNIRDHFRDHGFGLWAVEVRDVGESAMCGAAVLPFNATASGLLSAGQRAADGGCRAHRGAFAELDGRDLGAERARCQVLLRTREAVD